MKDAFERFPEHRSNSKGGFERWRIFAQLDRIHGLAGDPDLFRQFLLRGLDNVRGEWKLMTMAWNMKRMFALAGAN